MDLVTAPTPRTPTNNTPPTTPAAPGTPVRTKTSAPPIATRPTDGYSTQSAGPTAPQTPGIQRGMSRFATAHKPRGVVRTVTLDGKTGAANRAKFNAAIRAASADGRPIVVVMDGSPQFIEQLRNDGYNVVDEKTPTNPGNTVTFVLPPNGRPDKSHLPVAIDGTSDATRGKIYEAVTHLSGGHREPVRPQRSDGSGQIPVYGSNVIQLGNNALVVTDGGGLIDAMHGKDDCLVVSVPKGTVLNATTATRIVDEYRKQGITLPIVIVPDNADTRGMMNEYFGAASHDPNGRVASTVHGTDGVYTVVHTQI